MAESAKATQTKMSKGRAKRKAVGMEVVAKQAHTDIVEHTVRIAQLKGDGHENNGRLNVLERHNNVTDLQFFAK